jgi:beta-lactam-binding protein with PASTA domain
VESDQPADTVLRSNPPPGTTVTAGTSVDLVVAKLSPVFLGVGRTDPDPDYPDCATGYQTIFSQQISVTAPTRVTYQWLRSDRAGAPVEYVDFSTPGTKTVTTTWRRWGEPGETLTGWEQIKIVTPKVLTGEQLAFSHVCPGGPG